MSASHTFYFKYTGFKYHVRLLTECQKYRLNRVSWFVKIKKWFFKKKSTNDRDESNKCKLQIKVNFTRNLALLSKISKLITTNS